jgi:hypothetical protein
MDASQFEEECLLIAVALDDDEIERSVTHLILIRVYT